MGKDIQKLFALKTVTTTVDQWLKCLFVDITDL